MRDAPPSMEVVIVSYRSRRHVEDMLACLGGHIDAVVVDNADNVDGLREWAASRPGTRYVDGGGHGFASAANRGVRTSTHDVVAFVNPDARPTLDVLAELAADVTRDRRCASSAALTVGEDGAVETGNGGWEPSVLRAVAHTVGLHKLAPRAGIWARPQREEDLVLDWTTAACMAVRRETFLQLGGFDEGFFVYCEDVEFGRSVREAGLHQRLRTDLTVRHSAGSSGAPSLEMMQLRGAMLRRYVSAQHGRTSASIMAATLAAGFSAVRGADGLRGTRPARTSTPPTPAVCVPAAPAWQGRTWWRRCPHHGAARGGSSEPSARGAGGCV